MGDAQTRDDWVNQVFGFDVAASTKGAGKPNGAPGGAKAAAPGGVKAAAPGGSHAPGGGPAPGGGNAPGGPAAPVVPTDAAKIDDMDEEDLVASIFDKHSAILTGWAGALDIFQVVMTSSADADATPKFQSMLINFVANQLIGKVVAKTASQLPIITQVVGMIQAVQAEAASAAAASASAKLRDFFVSHKQTITALQQSLISHRQGPISAVKKGRQAAEASMNVDPKKKLKGGGSMLQVSDDQNQFFGILRMELMDMLAESEKLLGQSNTNALFKVISGEWLNSSQASVNALGATTAAWIQIKLDKNYGTTEAVFHGPGGQKLAEQMLKDSPGGVDVWGIKTLRSVVHLGHDYASTVFVDGGGFDATPPAGRNKETDDLFKWLKANGVRPTKNVSGA